MKTLLCIEHVGRTGWDSKIGSCIQFKGPRGYMIQGRVMGNEDGSFWMMKRTTCVKANYTREDVIERRLYNDAITLEDGETVQICMVKENGGNVEFGGMKQYKFKARGDCSNCGDFEEV